MDDLLNEFLTETNESLDVVDAELVRFEKDPNDKAVLDNIFRLVHTVKGTCGFLDLPRLEAVAHASENVLGKFRDGELQVTTEAVSLILESIDAIKSIMADLEATEKEPEGDDNELIGKLNCVAAGQAPDGGETTAQSAMPEAEPEPEPVAQEIEPDINPSLDRPLRPGEVSLDELEAAFAAAPGPDEEPGASADGAADDTSAEMASEAPAAEPVASEDSGNAPEKPVPAIAPAAKAESEKAEQRGGKAEKAEPSVATQSVRVNVDLLEDLMTMVSELVLTRNQLLQIVRQQEDSEFNVPLQRLNLVTTELQEGVMKTRMQPIGNAWQKLPRILRDLSHELGKKIDLQMTGADTELDRQVLELIKDPLTHMVRNSADHGLESTEGRIAAGKPPVGVIKLDAYHEGGHVIIQISDDGGGLNLDKIKSKALAVGLTTESELDQLSEQQISNFIFKAGFSTAQEVTSVSGRGVGMDVVRSNIEKIGGTVEVRSETGRGSIFTIKIPLTLAIVSALVVESCGERFAIPQISVVELVRASSNSEHRVEKLKETPVLRLRDQLLPLVYLSDVLGLEADPDITAQHDDEADVATVAKRQMEAKSDDEFVVVTQVGTFRFGIVVDRVFDTEEIVVKPVAPILRDISVFSGNTILGDGSVIMILDPNGIADACGEVKGENEEAALEAANAQDINEKISILIFNTGSAEPKAVPLSLVSRLEEVECGDIERSNGIDVVQYRGQVMPILRISDSYELRKEGRQPLLVFADETRTMGLAVNEIVDIVEEQLKIELPSECDGMLGTAVVNGMATEIVDVSHYLVKAFPDWFDENRQERAKSNKHLLLVDDSSFFRNMLAPLLATVGYKVTAVENADRALELRELGNHFDVIVSDIEMPGMDGFDLASEIRRDERWGKTPIVAISSHGTPQDFDRGRSVGFTDYVVKTDRKGLLESIQETLQMEGSAA